MRGDPRAEHGCWAVFPPETTQLTTDHPSSQYVPAHYGTIMPLPLQAEAVIGLPTRVEPVRTMLGAPAGQPPLTVMVSTLADVRLALVKSISGGVVPVPLVAADPAPVGHPGAVIQRASDATRSWRVAVGHGGLGDPRALERASLSVSTAPPSPGVPPPSWFPRRGYRGS